MADKSDKTFDPTPQRIQKAREEGNVFKSQEMSSVLMLVVGFSGMAAGMVPAFQILKRIASQVFIEASTTTLHTNSVSVLMGSIGTKVALILLPFMGLLFITGIAVNLMQSGINITTKPLVPKGSRINPQQGISRIFSTQGLFNTGKSLLKILVVGPIAYFTITAHLPEIMMLHTLPISGIMAMAAKWVLMLLAQLMVILFILSGIDYAYQKWKYNEDLKMSKQEIVDERKQSEGNPEIKVRQRQAARDLLRKPRLDHAVMKADVVVTNPTHYAVALRYSPEEGDAPRVLVKGIRKRALRIKALAKEYGIPTIEDRPLARALYKLVPEMDEIPEDLYPAVATILAEIYRKQGRRL